MATTFDAFLAERSRGRAWRPLALTEPVPVEQLPTPALVIDLDAMDRNLERMAEFLHARGVGARPHCKMHKCPLIAHRQLELGAVGVCAAKVAEAEVLRGAGIERILITSPVVTDDKLVRVVALAAGSEDVRIVVDAFEPARRLSAFAEQAGIVMRVLVDLDPDMGRTGIGRGEPALELAKAVDHLPGLELTGLQQYAGQVMHEPDYERRRERSREIVAAGLETRQRIEAAGLALEVFTGGGTGTFDIDSEMAGVTDLQVGSYVFMDEEYAGIAHGNAPRFETFEPALFVLVTAISQPREGLMTVDGGFKAFASDTVSPACRDIEGVRYHFGGDEHGILRLKQPSRPVNLGDRLWMVTSHCDPTVNLYDYYAPVRDGRVEALWPVAARGCSW